MARKQFLINYHTSDVQNMPSQENLRLGEIAVRHADAKPELIIKLDSGEFATFADGQTISGMVHTVNTGLAGRIDAAEGQIGEIKTTIQNNQTALTENFATKNYTNDEIVKAIASAQTFADTAKDDAIASGKTYTDEQIGKVDDRIDEVAGDVGELSGVVETFKADVNTNYALKTEVADAKAEAIGTASGYTDEAKIAAIAAASAYTDEKIATVNGRVDTVAGNVGTVSASVNTLRADLERDYTTKVYVDGEAVKAIASAQTFADTAKDNAIASGKTYTDEQVAAVNRSLETVAGDVKELSGAVETLAEDLTDVINTKVASAYIYKGSCTYANLPKGYGEDESGFVWNVTDANGNFPAGTNYAWTGTEWDALGGSLDLSPYALSADVKTHIDGVNGRIDGVAGNVGELSGVVETFKADVNTNYALKTEVADAKAEAIGTASGYTDEAKIAAIAAASAYTDEKIATVNGRVDTVAGDVKELSGVVETFKADVNTNYATKVYVDGEAVKAIASAQTFADTAKDSAIASGKSYTDEQVKIIEGDIDKIEARLPELDTAIQSITANSGVLVSKSGTTVTLDFTKMVIDGGEF